MEPAQESRENSQTFSNFKSDLLLFEYPLIRSMNDEEIADVFKSPNRCFLISWMLKIFDPSFEGKLTNFENDPVFLGNVLYELGFCAIDKGLPFMTGKLQMKEQLKILNKIFTFTTSITKIKAKENENKENKNGNINDGISKLTNINLNIFPRYGKIRTAEEVTSSSNNQNIVISVENVDEVCDVKKSLEKFNDALMGMDFHKLDKMSKLFVHEQETENENDVKFKPEFSDTLVRCYNGLKTLVQECCIICKEAFGASKTTMATEVEQLLRFLVTNVNFDLKDTLICKSCLVKVQSAYKFKTLYLESSHKVQAEKETPSQNYITCQICKNIIDASDLLPLFDSVTDTGLNLCKYLSEELESEILCNTYSCEMCHESLLNFYDVINTLSVYDHNTVVYIIKIENTGNFKDVPKTDNTVKNADISEIQLKNIKDEENVEREAKLEFEDFRLESEEIHLKMEKGEDEIEEAEGIWLGCEQEENVNCDSSERNYCTVKKQTSSVQNQYYLKQHTLVHRNSAEVKMFQCHICEFKTKNKYYLKEHILRHRNSDEVEMFKCHNCEFKTKYKNYLKQHILVHRNFDEVKMFKCHICEFKTKNKYYLKQHIHVHRNSEEMFKCHICKFKTKYKNYLKQHILVHRNSDEVEMFKCHICEFETKYKRYLKKHTLVHRNSDEVEIFKCHICEFETNRKRYLQRHILVHRNSAEVEMFKCHICEFKTKNKYYLKGHILIHKNCDEVEMFKCHVCEFKTKHKNSLKQHTLVHKNCDEVEMFKCHICEFKTKNKYYLKQHILVHRNSDEVEMFKCHNCEFQTKRKDYLKEHILGHRNSAEVEMFKCHNCKYKTKHKRNLKRHVLVHRNSDEVEMFKCHNCEFKTKYKNHLRKHIHKQHVLVDKSPCKTKYKSHKQLALKVNKRKSISEK